MCVNRNKDILKYKKNVWVCNEVLQMDLARYATVILPPQAGQAGDRVSPPRGEAPEEHQGDRPRPRLPAGGPPGSEDPL